jgi:hypothetical protein
MEAMKESSRVGRSLDGLSNMLDFSFIALIGRIRTGWRSR